MTIRMVGGGVFLLIPAHLGSPRQRAIKRLSLCVIIVKKLHSLKRFVRTTVAASHN